MGMFCLHLHLDGYNSIFRLLRISVLGLYGNWIIIMALVDKYLQIERRLQLDEGNRGIQGIVPDNPVIYEASNSLLQCSNIIILTGFPCLLTKPIKIETDGLAGALALGRTLSHLNKKVTILIESEYHSVLEPLLSWHNSQYSCDITLDSSLSLTPDGIISIERAGRSEDGNYYTMRGLVMDNLMPFDTVYLDSYQCKVKVAIGDGGNEAGMGPLKEKVKKFIKNGEIIASCSHSDFTLVSSVSTWGGYGLALSISYAAGIEPDVNLNTELQVSEKIMQCGICDGITGEISMGVDGLEWEFTKKLIEDLTQIIQT